MDLRHHQLNNRRKEVIGFHSPLIRVQSAINTLISFFATRWLGLHQRLVGNMHPLTSEQQQKLKKLSGTAHPEAHILAFGVNNSMQVYPDTFRAKFDQKCSSSSLSFARLQDQEAYDLCLLAPSSSHSSHDEEEKAAKTQAESVANQAKMVRTHQKVNCFAIPCGVKTVFGQHFVSLLVNFENHTIEYYDPQGIDPSQRKLSTFPHVDLDAYLEVLISELNSDEGSFTLKWQSGTHQHDTYNCVLYGTRFFEERMKGFTYDELMARWNEEAKKGEALQSITQYRGELFNEALMASAP